jgi:hypothetical protein
MNNYVSIVPKPAQTKGKVVPKTLPDFWISDPIAIG